MKLHRGILFLFFLAASHVASAAPTTYILDFTSQVTNGSSIDGGGMFNATLYRDDGTLNTSGPNTDFLRNLQTQCIDYWNTLALNTPFKVVLTSITSIMDGSGAAYTRFGSSFNDGPDSGHTGGQPADFANAENVCYSNCGTTSAQSHNANAAERYEMVAYLASLYKTIVDTGKLTVNGTVMSNSSSIRNAIQTAMWSLTQPVGLTSGGFESGTTDTGTQYWLNQAISAGLGQNAAFYSRWMVITEYPLTNLYKENGQTNMWQEQIVEITPEPRFYALLALGLAGLFCVHRKRQQPPAQLRGRA